MSRRAFTLIELLVVIGILALLAGLLVPAAGVARTAALKVRTRAQFGQWAVAMEQFRQEYGYYPAVDDGAHRLDPAAFAAALGACDASGNPLRLSGNAATDAARTRGNLKLIAFYAFAPGEIDPADGRMTDAFGNSDIAVLCDRNGDGKIDAADGVFPSVKSARTGSAFALALPAGAIRAGILFYSAGRGESADDLVLSWR